MKAALSRLAPVFVGLIAALSTTQRSAAQDVFTLPLRINIGGFETVDSLGRTWLGDGGEGRDALDIRPVDTGGFHTDRISNSSDGASYTALGFDPSHPGDRDIFNSFRWDLGGNPPDMIMDLPVPNGNYSVHLYFNEPCCPGRVFRIALQDEVVLQEYTIAPSDVAKLQRVSFDNVTVTGERLRVGLITCPTVVCTDAEDVNAILSALEVVPSGGTSCVDELTATVTATDEALLEWGDTTASLSGFELYRNGILLETLPAAARSFTDTPSGRINRYRLRPLTNPPGSCRELSARVYLPDLDFDAPLRINFGGPDLVDTYGRLWNGDTMGGNGALDIRPAALGGAQTIPNWCVPRAGTLERLGFDGLRPEDARLFSSVRWDNPDDEVAFRIELPIENGAYDVNLFLLECAAVARRGFKVEIEGQMLDADVLSSEYEMSYAVGTAGKLSFASVAVNDGSLSIRFLPCPECPGVTEPAPTVSALEVLPAGVDPCEGGFLVCPSALRTTIDEGGAVTGSWTAPSCVTVSGYELWRNGELIDELPANATSFEDVFTGRAAFYEVAPTGSNGCEAIGSLVVNHTRPFDVPLGLNLGGPSTVDSRGAFWLGDGATRTDPTNSARLDPLGIRPVGGLNVIGDFVNDQFKPESYTALGFDPASRADQSIFNSIRWDRGEDEFPFTFEIPIESGEYIVNLYFAEGCCSNRHMRIEIQGEVVADDVSGWDFDPAADRAAEPAVAPRPGFLGRLTFDGVMPENGVIRIRLLPCPTCPEPAAFVNDPNPAINAIEILPSGERPGSPTNVAASLDGTTATLSWTAPAGGVPATGYDVFRTSPGPRTKVNATPITTTQTTIPNLAGGESCFVVRAVAADGGQSQDSAAACVTVEIMVPEGSFRRGDADANGTLDLTDAIANLSYQFLGNTVIVCLDALDFDDNGQIQLSDPIGVLTRLFVGGSPPPPPGSDSCGPDPTEDALGCEAYPEASCN